MRRSLGDAEDLRTPRAKVVKAVHLPLTLYRQTVRPLASYRVVRCKIGVWVGGEVRNQVKIGFEKVIVVAVARTGALDPFRAAFAQRGE